MFVSKCVFVLGSLLAAAQGIQLGGIDVPDAPNGLEIVDHRMTTDTKGGPAITVL